MRARRIRVRRDAGKRRLRRLTLVLAVLALVVGAAVATRSPLLDVDRVEVTGAEQTSAGAVLEAAGSRARRALVSVDVAAAARRVEALPWVDDATGCPSLALDRRGPGSQASVSRQPSPR